MPYLKRDNPKFPGEELNITLPLGVSVNSMYLPGRNKPLTKKAKAWLREAQQTAQTALIDQDWTFESGKVWIRCYIDFYYPNDIRRDSHNYFKLLFDALEGYIYIDDRYVLPTVGIIKQDKGEPRMELTFIKLNSDFTKSKGDEDNE